MRQSEFGMATRYCWDGSIAETTYGTVINQQNLYGGTDPKANLDRIWTQCLAMQISRRNAYMESQLLARQ